MSVVSEVKPVEIAGLHCSIIWPVVEQVAENKENGCSGMVSLSF